MESNEKIIQISGSGDVVYALSSDGKLYIGTLHEKGFEWKKLPPMNYENMGSVIILKAGDENAQAVISAAPGAEIVIPKIMFDEVIPDAVIPEASKPEEPKPEGEALKK